MKLLPYRKITLHTGLSKQECAEALSKNMFPRSPDAFNFSDPNGKKFIGRLYADSFQMRRAIKKRNSFLPLINGRLISMPSGTDVVLRFKMHGFVNAFMVIWCSALLFASLMIAGTALLYDEPVPAETLIPIGMMLLGMLIMTGGFGAEYENARKEIMQLFKDPEQD